MRNFATPQLCGKLQDCTFLPFAFDALLAQWLTQVPVCTGDCDSMEQLGVALFFWYHLILAT